MTNDEPGAFDIEVACVYDATEPLHVLLMEDAQRADKPIRTFRSVSHNGNHLTFLAASFGFEGDVLKLRIYGLCEITEREA